jgi:hypothetical protein
MPCRRRIDHKLEGAIRTPIVASSAGFGGIPRSGSLLPDEGPERPCPLESPVVQAAGASRSTSVAPDLDASAAGSPGLDEEATPARSRQQSAHSSEHRPIRWLQGRTCHLSTQDGDLMAKHHDFYGQLIWSIT